MNKSLPSEREPLDVQMKSPGKAASSRLHPGETGANGVGRGGAATGKRKRTATKSFDEDFVTENNPSHKRSPTRPVSPLPARRTALF